MTKQKRIKHIFQAIAALIVIIMCIAVAMAMKNGVLSSQRAFTDFVKSAGIFAPIVFLVIEITSVVIAILPCSLGYPVSAAAFGPVFGFILNAVATMAGSLIIFWIVRVWGKPLVEAVVEKKHFDKYGKLMEKTSMFEKILVPAMLVPFFPDNVLCYLAGLTKIEFKRFFMIVVIFKPWKILFYTCTSQYLINKFSHLWADAMIIFDKILM